MSLQVVVGFGPAGAATARTLVGQGHEVRVVTRSTHPAEDGIEFVAVDAAAGDRLAEVAAGASVIYHCAAPPYTRWPQELPALTAGVTAAAEASGAVLVLLNNLYGYGPVDGPLTEDLPLAATGRKGRVRAQISQDVLALHRQGRIRAVEARASDYFGPGVTAGGHLADRVVPAVLRGRTVRVLGDPAMPHSWTYVPDVASALIRLGTTESAWGRPWHVPTVPPETIQAMVTKLCEAAGTAPVGVRRVPPALVRVLGVVSPFIRELDEVRYQFDRPFVVDSTACAEHLGLAPTPLSEQMRSTVQWWRGASPQAG
ncbi:NAD-dependent epimerase/dehydratase family protein [Actinoplanes sp. KI2]|uniref:NAD-dependent epimerase/dehydratase family protein n=1 Tax=Actinoplanes sp. KI2 TaxID=2983315 RepID=UPI0021D573ED|nr:NAD-dependent epimerase/dehydratase family protein [Actinoplanes sp. KI2]MCU7728901.1 NAD-dependent epimerase/dehydratase family protein [Actinoplanes sp. KI2]